MHNFLEKLKEALSSVLPISILVIILVLLFVPMPDGMMAQFVIAALLLIVGMTLFTLGVDISMMVIGEKVGVFLTKSKKIFLVIIISFLIGMFITIAEPDLHVLAAQTPGVPNFALIISVAIGVGVFLVFASLRVLFKMSLSMIILVTYIFIFILAIFVPSNFVPLSFDSGGVTTGPITVPFILAYGAGMATTRGDKDSSKDSFGFVGLCSAGPIIATMVLGILFKPASAEHTAPLIIETNSFKVVLDTFIDAFPIYFAEVALAMLPILLFYFIFQIFIIKQNIKQVIRVLIGFLYTYTGLVLFLTGANVGFMSAGYFVGSELYTSRVSFLIIPISMLIGFLIVAAEPAVHVLENQVEDISEGNISAKSLQLSLSFGVAISVGLAMTRVITRISIWWFLIPGYLIALILMKFVPKMFTAIAFDSGGVASGPMTATFLLSLSIGATEAAGGDILKDAFGTVAMVAMTPLIAIQILGLISEIKAKRALETVGDYEIPEDVIFNDEFVVYDTYYYSSKEDEKADDVKPEETVEEKFNKE